MDPKTVLKRVVGEISFALTQYAKDHKWSEGEYWIYYSIDAEWDVVSFVFVAKGFDAKDERGRHVDVWKYLIDRFKDDPEILRYVSLVVRGKAEVDRGGLGAIGPGYEQFPTDFEEFWTISPAQAAKN